MKTIIKTAAWILKFFYRVSGIKWIVSEISCRVMAYKLRLRMVPTTYKLFLVALGIALGSSGMYVEIMVPKQMATVYEQSNPLFTNKVEAKEKEIKTCEDAVEVYGKQYGNADLLGRIVKAESNNNSQEQSKTTTARGCAQFVIGTWEQYGKEHWGEEFFDKNIYSPKDNVELLAWAISTKGTGDWNASRAAWAQ